MWVGVKRCELFLTINHELKHSGWALKSWLLIVSLFLLTGCSGAQVSRLQNTVPTSTDILSTVAAKPIDLAVLDIDFDPPLEHLQWAVRDQVTLLVAITNVGEEVASDVIINVRLVSQERGDAEPTEIVASQLAGALAPGEVRVVHFQPLEQLPVSLRYRLTVSVEPAMGEMLTENNERVFDIVIGAE